MPLHDSDPHGQIARIFAIARHFDLDIDFHLDFDLDPARMDLTEVCRQTDAFGMAAESRSACDQTAALRLPNLQTWHVGSADTGRCGDGVRGDRPCSDGFGLRSHIPRASPAAHKLANV